MRDRTSTGNHSAANPVEPPMQAKPAIGILLSTLALSSESGLERRIDAAAHRLEKEIPGFSIAVVIDGRAAYAKGFGAISLTSPTAATPDTQDRLPSVSKADYSGPPRGEQRVSSCSETLNGKPND